MFLVQLLIFSLIFFVVFIAFIIAWACMQEKQFDEIDKQIEAIKKN